MSILKGACIVGQSGGPTSVINSSVYGVIDTALKSPAITRVLGADHGITGILNDRLFDMGQEDPDELRLLKYTPSSVLGSCRYKIKNPEEDLTDYRRILEIFKKYDVRYFFYNGGNDSMDTCSKISSFLRDSGYECRVVGVPKTIDNDLYGTDHTPGFGSAAKYIATTFMEVAQDAGVYGKKMVCVIEMMGRQAGWLTAASALATQGFGPDLVYLPEVPFDMDKYLADVGNVLQRKNLCMVAVSHGLQFADGSYVSESTTGGGKDAFGHVQLSGTGAVLAAAAEQAYKIKVRSIELSLLQRCSSHAGSAVDIEEAFLAGKAAVEAALDGVTDKMIAFERSCEAGEYRCTTKLIDLADVANAERNFPLEWINAEKNGITQDFIDYAKPLIAGEPELPRENFLPRYAHLKKIQAE